MNFGKSLIAAAFIGNSVSVLIESSSNDSRQREIDWNKDWLKSLISDEGVLENFHPLYQKAVHFCHDNIEDHLEWCVDNV